MTSPTSYYQLLSLSLLYPQPALLPQLEAAAAEIESPWAAELVAAFKATPLDELQMEHTRLFVNNMPAVPCPPYEAAYVDGHLMSATTGAVASFYAEWGLAQSLETADFLPVELQFVAYLAELSAQQPTASVLIEQARRQFEREHLRPWLPRFAADVQVHAGLEFYRRVGQHLAALLP
jgi:TorA maturation chaperone TorD